VNDRYGHETGDLLLIGVARALHRGVREEDLAARIGGDEFVLILRACSIDHGVHICERIRSRVKDVRIPTGAGYVTPAASMGIAEAGKGFDVAALMASADEALYTAKRLGGNVVRTSALTRSA
jgi:diguanylate cyclase (GGDEF)-like protein